MSGTSASGVWKNFHRKKSLSAVFLCRTLKQCFEEQFFNYKKKHRIVLDDFCSVCCPSASNWTTQKSGSNDKNVIGKFSLAGWKMVMEKSKRTFGYHKNHQSIENTKLLLNKWSHNASQQSKGKVFTLLTGDPMQSFSRQPRNAKLHYTVGGMDSTLSLLLSRDTNQSWKSVSSCKQKETFSSETAALDCEKKRLPRFTS